LTNKKLHILILSNSFPTVHQPLAGIFWKEQAEQFISLGNKVGVIAIIPISIKDIIKKGKVFSFEKLENSSKVFWQFSYPNFPGLNFLACFISRWIGFYLFKRYLKFFGQPDIMHVHRYEAGLLACRIKKNYGIPFFVTEHSSKFLYNELNSIENKIAKKVFLESDKRIVVSSHLKNVLENKFNIQFLIIPNGVDCEFFNSSNNENKEKNKEYTIFSAGNLTKNKNHSLLIHAFSRFNEFNSNSKLIIAGEGPEKAAIRNLILDLNLEDKVTLTGRLNRETIRTYYSKMDLFVLPSIKETFGVVIIEALSSGKPVVSTKCGGPEDIICEEFLGVLCDSNIDSMYCAIDLVFLNKHKYDPNKIHSYILNNFDQKQISINLVELYKKTLLTIA
jgi:glycosyltransferase involved in cell wall biosynthesis